MSETPRGPGRIIPLNNNVARSPEKVLELRRKELDDFAKQLVAAGAEEAYKNQRVPRMVLATKLGKYGDFTDIESHLIKLREKILAYENIKKRVVPMQPAPAITIEDISYADAYLEKRREMKATPREES